MFGVTQATHFVLKRLGLPHFVSQVVAGLLLSPSISILPEVIGGYLFHEKSIELLGTFGTFGFAFFIFLSGVKVDVKMAMRVGRQVMYIGVLSILVPLLFTFAIVMILYKDPKERYLTAYMSSLFCLSSFPVINCVLTDLKIPNTELGRLGFSSAVIADLGSSIVIFYRILSRIASIGADDMYHEMGYLVLFVLAVVIVYRPLMMLVVRFTPEGGQVNMIFVYACLLPFLLCMHIPILFRDFSMFLVYGLGLAVPPGPPLGSALVDKFEGMVSGFFLPLYVTACSMRIDEIQLRFFDPQMQKIAFIAVATLLVKFTACLLPLLHKRIPKKDAMAIAAISCSKGIVEISSITIASDLKILSQDQFSLVMAIITLTSGIVPIIVRKLHDPSRKFVGYQRRKITDCKPNSELQIIACIHVPNNVNSVINFLGFSHPTRENPIALSVLHLVKLNAAQASPIFLSHQNGTKNVTGYCYSENVILSFKKFEGINWGAVSVNVFTAISPSDFMDDDICTLALDKLSSFVILPFHRTWYIDGSLESEDPIIRNLNCRVLEKAPCSVGILIDHGNIKRPTVRADSFINSSSKIAVLFMGGSDDREALALALRMAKDTRVGLTVAHFIAESDDGVVDWETILDSEILREVKNDSDISYERHMVNSGPETVNIVHQIVNDNSLIIVGRNCDKEIPQTCGLKEWSEFPELGILGDLLASKDLGGKCSVMVVQQQQSVQLTNQVFFFFFTSTHHEENCPACSSSGFVLLLSHFLHHKEHFATALKFNRSFRENAFNKVRNRPSGHSP
ncbi:hypothetical protein Q3G72_006641 [Acer saccharum]|nr:hypothetical protein Q3G72_006641 [Acer saccharum]